MILLNTRSIMDCDTEEEIELHNQETITFIEKLSKLKDYECAVLCKYQDKAHKDVPMKIESTSLHYIDEVWQWGDFKNGVDLLADETLEYLVFVTYGQSYQLKSNNSWHTVVEAFKILPYDENRNFLNVVDYCINNKPVVIAKNQYERID